MTTGGAGQGVQGICWYYSGRAVQVDTKPPHQLRKRFASAARVKGRTASEGNVRRRSGGVFANGLAGRTDLAAALLSAKAKVRESSILHRKHNHFMRPSLFLIAAFIISPSASATSWFELFKDDTGSTVYVDMDTVTEKDGIQSIWLKFLSGDPKAKIHSSKEKWMLDCDLQKYNIVVNIDYAKSGAVIYEHQSDILDWKYAAPETNADGVLYILCSDKTMRTDSTLGVGLAIEEGDDAVTEAYDADYDAADAAFDTPEEAAAAAGETADAATDAAAAADAAAEAPQKSNPR